MIGNSNFNESDLKAIIVKTFSVDASNLNFGSVISFYCSNPRERSFL